MAIDILLINAIIHIITFIYAFYRFRRFNLYVVIWLAYSIVTFMGYYCVRAGLHYSHDVNLGYKVSWEPYLFSYITTLLLTYPISKIDITKVRLSIYNVRIVRYLSYSLVVVYLLRLLQAIVIYRYVSNTIGFGEAYLMIHGGESIYNESNNLVGKFMTLSQMLDAAFRPVYVIYFLYIIAKRNGHWLLNFSLVMLAFLPEIVLRISGGSKGGLFYVAIELLFYFTIFSAIIPKVLMRKIYLCGFVGGLSLMFFSMIITASRIEARSSETESPFDEISIYLGESYPNLGWHFYGKVKRHPYGRRFFPEFFSPNPEKLYWSPVDGKFDYWSKITHVRMSIFKTFWGDWYVEFGLVGSFLAIILLYFICYYWFLKNYYVAYYLPLLAFYYCNILSRGCFIGSGLEGSKTHMSILLLIFGCYLLKMAAHSKIK